MGKRPGRIYTGMYTEKRRHGRGNHQTYYGILRTELSRLAGTYIWTCYSSVNYHYLALVTVCVVVLLSYMLPNISHKLHRTTELKQMKKMIDVMAKEVSQAEVACLTMVDQLGCLHDSKHDGVTETLTEQRDLAVSTCDSMRTAQSAPVQVEKKMGIFKRIFFPYKNTSKKEIAIMSYVYTDSFDEIKNKPETNPAEQRIF